MSKKRDFLAITRREVGGLIVTGGVMLAGVPAPSTAMLTARSSGRPVVGFHNDGPWLDQTGRDTPYPPPTATGRFAPDSESLMRLGYFL